MKKWSKVIVVMVLLTIGTVASMIFYQQSKIESGIPKDILKKTAFSVFTIDPKDKIWSLESSSTTYDKTSGILILNFINSTNRITASEQITPDVFTDIPNYTSTLLNLMHQYAELQTAIGTVALTKPVEFKGGQKAFINSGGTLMFYTTKEDMTDDQWKQFFNSLIVIK